MTTDIEETGKQIQQLTQTMTILSREVQSVSTDVKNQDQKVDGLNIDMKSLLKRNAILWAIILLLAGALIS